MVSPPTAVGRVIVIAPGGVWDYTGSITIQQSRGLWDESTITVRPTSDQSLLPTLRQQMALDVLKGDEASARALADNLVEEVQGRPRPRYLVFAY